ncbi:hypothetical protein HW571_27600 [Agrobacterium genomosp. 3]|uniref:hypothetical protein n=1 Tax=Agrobacterium tomkonis TaxID=1183410 RepID=UPI001CD8712C|nr:hypothetical protein [Agrobacterium tomkonis]MCA1879744.1 hypothetical protein [Agrobacterium tumefaciens]MCA1894962.1 hypothetical protein [Agrobacterium tomkonis]
MTPVDVWDLASFDEDLLALLQPYGEMLLNYELADRRNYEERQLADQWVPLKANPYTADRMHLLEHIIMPAMSQRTIRAWHYTRLTDDEAALFKTNGVQIADVAGIRRRLDTQVEAGTISSEVANTIYWESPFHTQESIRSGKFWMGSHPLAITDSRVELLLQHWGGEGIYFWLKDPDHIKLVQNIGRARVIELAVPLSLTDSIYPSANAVVSTYVSSLGGTPECSAFDLYVTSALTADAVLNIHSEGEGNFAAMANGYPVGFRDCD